MANGNCYAVTEAAYYILGGKKGDWKIERLKLRGEPYSHWYLRHKRYPDVILDLSRKQFSKLPDYTKGVGAAFLTQRPSRRARVMMARMTWDTED